MARDGTMLGYRPALDGLRGVAVLAVLLFHADISWARGGYLGVSVFFTLSGFLITRLLLEEHGRSGRVGIARFYGRRVRRLVPGSVVTLLGVILLLHLGLIPSPNEIRRDVTGAALQIGNWTQLTSTRSYADLFGPSASPVDHYWSLAVEEQFYLLWPLVAAALLTMSGRHARRAVVVLFLLSAAAAPLIAARYGTDAAYFATPSRLAEILAGAALATVFSLGSSPRWIRPASIVSAALVLAAFVLTPTDHGWPYLGGLPLFAVLSACIVAGALDGGPVRRVLSWHPFVSLGTVSYSLYLVHWPIYLLVDVQWDSLATVRRTLVKLALSLVVAVALALGVERPIRAIRLRPFTVPIGLTAIGATLAVTLAVLPTVAADDGGVAAGLPRRSDDLEPGGTTSSSLGSEPAAQARPVRIMLVGDSTGDVVGGGLVSWSNAHPDLAQVEVRSIGACGLVAGGSYRTFLDGHRTECDRANREEIPASWTTVRPDVVVIMISLADTWERAWNDDGPLLHAADPEYAAHIAEGYNRFFDAAAAAGVPHVIWLRPPMTGAEERFHDPSFLDGSQEVIERVVRDALTRHPDMLSIVDFRSWFETTPLATDQAVRPDGVHLNPQAARQVADDFLGPAILSVARGDAPAPPDGG